MDRSSAPARWPWRKWFLAGALGGVATTVGGPIAVGGCSGESSACASDATIIDACACVCPPDACLMRKDVATDAPSHEEASVDAGAPDAVHDAPAEASDGTTTPGG
jgi:hypothetical protein